MADNGSGSGDASGSASRSGGASGVSDASAQAEARAKADMQLKEVLDALDMLGRNDLGEEAWHVWHRGIQVLPLLFTLLRRAIFILVLAARNTAFCSASVLSSRK